MLMMSDSSWLMSAEKAKVSLSSAMVVVGRAKITAELNLWRERDLAREKFGSLAAIRFQVFECSVRSLVLECSVTTAAFRVLCAFLRAVTCKGAKRASNRTTQPHTTHLLTNGNISP